MILTNKSIIFTGGSGFLGATMVRHLLDCGAYVVNLGRKCPEPLAAEGVNGRHIGVDFYDTEALVAALAQAVDSARAATGSVDILVNNSFDFSPRTGFNDPSGRIETITKETFLSGVESGLYWPLVCSQEVGRAMIVQGGGNIVNILSLYAFLVADYRMYKGRTIFNPVTYPVAKHGLLGLTRYIASFWSEHHIRCNCLSPGTFPNIQKPDRDSDAVNKVQEDAFIKILEGKCSTGRVGLPEDLLGAIEFLCSDKSAYMTGSNVVVDGGWAIL